MSFWGATVITNFFSAIPGVGETVVTWLWGGFAVGNPTLNRFYSLHYLLPFVIAGVVILHVWALHVSGQNNPTGIEPKSDRDTVPFTPYALGMSNAELTQAAMSLPAEDRLELARRLVESVALPAPLTPAVAEGIRRIEDVATGRVSGLTEEQLRTALQ
jgi:putative addiction module component (TIGR02574 family)